MSHRTSTFGSLLNSSQVSRTGFSTRPSMRKSHVRRSARGTLPSCKTGHFSVSDCPGGKRCSLRICCSSFFRSLPSPKSIFIPFVEGNLLYLNLPGALKFLRARRVCVRTHHWHIPVAPAFRRAL